MTPAPMKFCSDCGAAAIAWRVPDGHNAPREVCGGFGSIPYRNPKVVVRWLPQWEQPVLLCRRALGLFERCVELSPDNPDYLKTLAGAYARENRTVEASDLYRTLVELEQAKPA